MPVVFPDFVQTCVPLVAFEAPTVVVSLESRFAPFNIRINSSAPLRRQPATRTEAIKGATSLAATRRDTDFRLCEIAPGELWTLDLSIPDAFDPRLKQKATATPLDGEYRLAVKLGAGSARAEQAAQSHYGRNDLSVGGMVNDDQVRREIERLGPTMARFAIGDTGRDRGQTLW